MADLRDGLDLDFEQKIGEDFLPHGAGIDFLIYLNTALKYDKVKYNNTALSYFRSHAESLSTLRAEEVRNAYNTTRKYIKGILEE